MLDTFRNHRSNSIRFEIVRSPREIGDRGVSKDLMSFVDYSDLRVRNEAVSTIVWDVGVRH